MEKQELIDISWSHCGNLLVQCYPNSAVLMVTAKNTSVRNNIHSQNYCTHIPGHTTHTRLDKTYAGP